VNVSGAEDLSSVIQQFAQQKLAGHYFFLFPKNNVALYPKQDIERGLLAQYPTLASVSVYNVNLHAIGVTATERQPVAQWCSYSDAAVQSESTSTAPTACWYIDENGVVYAPVVGANASTFITFTSSNSSPTLPWQFLTPVQFQSLSALVTSILQNKITDNPLIVASVDQYDDVRLQFASGFTLLFSLDDDSGDIYSRLSLALTSDPFTSNPLSDFEYLDLRFGDKLYYKLKSP
jgi:hypothetical protein